ncbi:MAG: hypothetical protein ACOYYS_02545 [Chloroflexota bacterium]
MQAEFEAILTSDLADLEKLTQAYQFILKEQMAHGRREIELQQALGDQDALIKEKIKLGVMEYTNDIFGYCYLRVTGRRLDHDEPSQRRS